MGPAAFKADEGTLSVPWRVRFPSTSAIDTSPVAYPRPVTVAPAGCRYAVAVALA